MSRGLLQFHQGPRGCVTGPARPQISAVKRGGGEGANLISSIQMRGESLPLWGTGRGTMNFGMSRENLGAAAGLGHGDVGTDRSSSPGSGSLPGVTGLCQTLPAHPCASPGRAEFQRPGDGIKAQPPRTLNFHFLKKNFFLFLPSFLLFALPFSQLIHPCLSSRYSKEH